MPHIASTSTCDVACHIFGETLGNISSIKQTIVIKGGHGLADQRTLVTQAGAVLTPVTDDELAALSECRVFMEAQKLGFFTVINGDAKPDGEAVAADMARNEGAAPLTPADFPDAETSGSDVKSVDGKSTPVVGAAKRK